MNIITINIFGKAMRSHSINYLSKNIVHVILYINTYTQFLETFIYADNALTKRQGISNKSPITRQKLSLEMLGQGCQKYSQDMLLFKVHCFALIFLQM